MHPPLSSLLETARQIRRDIIRMVSAVQSGHPGGSLGCTEFFTALFFQVLRRKDHFDMQGHNEDVFFLSNGHISPVYYSSLARAGYFPVEELASFRRLNSRLQGHPTTHEGLPGIRIASGSLGQGLSVACGMALAKRMNQDPHLVYALCGDGELQEGQIWEAAMFAAHYQLDNLLLTIDWNGQQIDGSNDQVMSLGDLAAKWQSFGWKVLHAEQGNDLEQLLRDLQLAQQACHQGQPVVLLMKTQMGYGVDFMQGTHEWHGKAPNAQQTEQALQQLSPTSLGDY